MADFLTAFTAMWNNEGEIWSRGDGLFRINETRWQLFSKEDNLWLNVTITSEETLARDWRKFDGRKEVSWWEAWEWGKEHPDEEFWSIDGVLHHHEETHSWTTRAWSLSVGKLLQVGVAWYIPADAAVEVEE